MLAVLARAPVPLARGKDTLEASSDALWARVHLAALDLALAAVGAAERLELAFLAGSRLWARALHARLSLALILDERKQKASPDRYREATEDRMRLLWIG